MIEPAEYKSLVNEFWEIKRFIKTDTILKVNPYGLSDPSSAKTYENVEKGGFFYEPLTENQMKMKKW